MALETVRAQLPDLILLDVRMPEINGFEVCAALKQASQTQEIPILFISASTEVDDKVKAFEVGGADYITKPFRVREVLARVNHQLTIRQQQQQLTDLYHQVQAFNNSLEQQIQERTRELQQALEKLQRLNQLKDDFLGTISDELRTPIVNTHLVLQLLTAAIRHRQDASTTLADSESSNDRINQVSQYLGNLQEGCDREIHLIQTLLDLHRLNAGTYPLDWTPVNLYDSIPPLLESFAAPMQEKQQTLQVQLAPDLPLVHSDRTSLHRILTELLNNACKHTPTGGTITLAVKFQPSTDAPLDRAVIQIAIANTGSEIPEQEQSHIFDQFCCDPSNAPGKHDDTGLGLALMQKLVEQLQGCIWVRSSDNTTCFIVQLTP